MKTAGLSAAAIAVISRIEALLEEAEDSLARTNVVDETTYAIRETGKRYLPDTVASYLALPPSQRDATAEEMFLGQLTLLERATAQRLSTLSDTLRMTQAANGAFLEGKFGTLASLPEAPAQIDTKPSPKTLVSRLFEQLDSTSADPHALVEMAAQRFTSILPALTTVKKGMFGGATRSVTLDVPVGDHLLRYAISAERASIEAQCTKVVRGIALKTERVQVGDWLRKLFEDVSSYVERDNASRDSLAAFFKR